MKSGRSSVASRTFDRKQDAEAWKAAQVRALHLGDWVDPKAGRLSVATAIEQWREQREGSVSSKTLKEEGYALAALPTKFRNLPLNAVRVGDLEALYAERLAAGLARSSVARLRNTLSALWAWAVRATIVARNPVLESKVPRGTGTGSSAEIYPFAIGELRDLHAHLRATVQDHDAADIVLVLGLTGLRWGELAALRVRDVQVVPHAALRVSRSKTDGHPLRSATKGGKARTVPLSGELLPIVLPRVEGRPADAPLFPNEAGNCRLLSNWKRAVHWERNGRGRRVHDLRHTAATLWLANGVDVKTAQAWLGHSTATLTVDKYAHWIGASADAAAMARLDAAISPVQGGHRGDANSNLRTAKGTD